MMFRTRMPVVLVLVAVLAASACTASTPPDGAERGDGASPASSATDGGGMPSDTASAEEATPPGAVEIDNVAMYDRLFVRDLAEDLVDLLSRLRGMSEDRHLPAFEAALANGGVGAEGGMGHGGGSG